jgi:hypothetical protein
MKSLSLSLRPKWHAAVRLLECGKPSGSFYSVDSFAENLCLDSKYADFEDTTYANVQFIIPRLG